MRRPAAYDQLDRLTRLNRGHLNSGSTSIADQDATCYQSFTLDGMGNWAGFDNNGQSQSRSHNAANELTGITQGQSSLTPTFDAAGNMTSGPAVEHEFDGTPGLSFTYDAWNRLTRVEQDDDGDGTLEILAEYEYDGLNRRIVKETGGHRFDYYYNEDWQLVQTDRDGRT